MSSIRGSSAVALLTVAAAVGAGVGCRRGTDSTSQNTDVKEASAASRQVLSFPTQFYQDDQTVNDFVRQAMTACANGKYDEFRVLWTARQEPLNRGEYDAGWQAVESIDVRALEPVKLAVQTDSGEILERKYVLLADVRFDPEHPAGRKAPRREVVLLLTKDQERWRLARAPERIRTWVRELATEADAGAAPNEPASTENASSPPGSGG